MNKLEENMISLGTIDESGSSCRQERRDAAANRARILQTAEKLFAQHGVPNVNMADIAQAAEVGKGTLYRRFTNKAELCLALMDTQMIDFQNGMIARMQQMSAQKMPKMEQLDQFIDALIYFTDAHAPLLCEVQRAGLLQDQEPDRLELPHFWQFMTVSGLLKAAVSSGELPENLDIDYLADALLAPLKADLFYYQRETRGFSLERISAGLRALVAGLRHSNGAASV
ncbi:MAG: helix-turn-helix transcriptional regulator [Ardenticatenaceae bacterium]|nr:helix-turn-helix transcriptional regulator [Anaerolineales bacterium]MCB8941391.1 helix-turn-helix transcriptional regulator [Ardenticatenaceae bacterium]MCB8972747.1 helix-turn-helix transcriptional regulator [Ardenticatenaceae bacterium]